MRRLWLLLAVAAVSAMIWGGYLAHRASSNLVTLNVRQMDVRRVVSKIQWQTWERIIVNRKVEGKVTLNVRAVPLEEVLNIIALQTSSRWSGLYPLYSSGKSVVSFKKLVRGDTPVEGSGWTNLYAAPAWWRNRNAGFGNNARAANNLVSASFAGSDLDFAALALSRFSQAQVVPEDGSVAIVTLRLEQVPFEVAVAKLARQARRKFDHLYTLQPLRRAPQVVSLNETANTSPVATAAAARERAEAQAEQEQRQFDALVATMTPAERDQAEAQRKAFQELGSLSPAERQQRLQQLAAQAGPAARSDLQQRMQNRLKNTTPEQRVEGDRSRLERKRQRPANPPP